MPCAPKHASSFEFEALLKADLFGRVERGHSSDASGATRVVVRRDLGAAAWWARPIAKRLAAREARALEALIGVDAVPTLLHWDGRTLVRSWIEGRPMQQARPDAAEYFEAAMRLLVRLHRHGVTHNDLAKEPNWLVDEHGAPALVDFQLARVHARRTRWFRLKGREDLRHLTKHKRTYRRDALTEREHALLSHPAWPSRLWRATGKPVYVFVTRRLLGWADREGAGDRGAGKAGSPPGR